MKDILNRVAEFTFVIIADSILILVCSIPAMFLWNWLMPTLFHLPVINVFQMWGLIVLCGIFRMKIDNRASDDVTGSREE